MQLNYNKINADYLAVNTNTSWRGIDVFDTIDSTSSWLKKQTQTPLVCIAETQTQGRGRNGNRWSSPDAENVYLSFNWLFQHQISHLPLLSLWVGIAIAETIATLGIHGHGIKWPNDLYCQQKKMGGVLIETSSASSEVIVGIGINVNAATMTDVDQPWTSLSAIAGHRIDRNEFLIKLLDALYLAMDSFAELSSNELQSKWLKWDLIKGQFVSFLQNGEVYEGRAEGIDSSGHLLVEMISGETKAFNTSISKVRWS